MVVQLIEVGILEVVGGKVTVNYSNSRNEIDNYNTHTHTLLLLLLLLLQIIIIIVTIITIITQRALTSGRVIGALMQ